MNKRANIFIILLLIISFFSALSISWNNIEDVGKITIEATQDMTQEIK